MPSTSNTRRAAMLLAPATLASLAVAFCLASFLLRHQNNTSSISLAKHESNFEKSVFLRWTIRTLFGHLRDEDRFIRNEKGEYDETLGDSKQFDSSYEYEYYNQDSVDGDGDAEQYGEYDDSEYEEDGEFGDDDYEHYGDNGDGGDENRGYGEYGYGYFYRNDDDDFHGYDEYLNGGYNEQHQYHGGSDGHGDDAYEFSGYYEDAYAESHEGFEDESTVETQDVHHVDSGYPDIWQEDNYDRAEYGQHRRRSFVRSHSTRDDGKEEEYDPHRDNAFRTYGGGPIPSKVEDENPMLQDAYYGDGQVSDSDLSRFQEEVGGYMSSKELDDWRDDEIVENLFAKNTLVNDKLSMTHDFRRERIQASTRRGFMDKSRRERPVIYGLEEYLESDLPHVLTDSQLYLGPTFWWL